MVLENPTAHNREYKDAHSDHPANKGDNLAVELWKGLENNLAGRLVGQSREKASEPVLDFSLDDPYTSKSGANDFGKPIIDFDHSNSIPMIDLNPRGPMTAEMLGDKPKPAPGDDLNPRGPMTAEMLEDKPKSVLGDDINPRGPMTAEMLEDKPKSVLGDDINPRGPLTAEMLGGRPEHLPSEVLRHAPPGSTDHMAKAIGEAPALSIDRAESHGDSRTADAAALKKIFDDMEAKVQRIRLENDIAKLPESERERFKKDMEAFEHRAAAMQPPLKPEEIAKTYDQIAKLLEAKDGKVSENDRTILAEQIMHHAADPTGIDQGKHYTCNVSTVESRIFTRNPSAAAEMITEVALTGGFTTHGVPSRHIVVDSGSLKPDRESEGNNPPKDHQRSYASQIFQVTAVNVAHQVYGMENYEDGKLTRYPPGTLQYRQEDPQYGAKPPGTGEKLVDTRTGKQVIDVNGNPIDHPNLDDDSMVNIYNQISGARPGEKGMLLANQDLVSPHSEKVSQFKNEHDFKKQLDKALHEHRLPIILKVSGAQEPFFTDSGGGAAGGSGADHVVTITDYNPKTGEVTIDNQWGKGSDHAVKIHDLYNATMTPQHAIKTLEKECAEDAKHHIVDHAKEAQLLRLKHENGMVDDDKFDRQLTQLVLDAMRDANEHHKGVLDATTKTELVSMLTQVAKQDVPRVKAILAQTGLHEWMG